ncbi:MAG: nucleotidyltransferase domain-containing protein [Nitrospirae bacterium]|nr:nucleotidyltransferase domain-containing protein [Nitrospirota bacterium]
MSANNLETLKEYFKDRDNVLLAFIFGSAVSGRLTEESDIDIGLLFGNAPGFQDVLKITAEVSEAAGRQVDIVVLNDSSPIIRMQVLKNGELLKKGDAAYCDFYVRTVKEYDDLKHIRKEAEEKMLKGRIYA